MNEIDKVLQVAENEIGYKEKASNNDLDNKDANVGNNNYTKYARDMDNLDVYNTKKQGYPWCNIFIDWCFVKALGVDRARQLLYGWSAGCTQDWNWFKEHGRIVDNPQRGDLVFFGDCDHIGIIYKVENGKIYTIEGNTNNGGYSYNGGEVCKKEYSINDRHIKGYARPNYNDNEVVAPSTTPTNETTYPLLKKGSKGNFVRILQEKLLAKGYMLPKYGVDGDFGSETERAVKELQEDARIDIDGIVGPDTWGVLNNPNFVKPNESYPGYLIKKGQISDTVRKVQQRLIDLGYNCGRYGADSIFGIDTYNAVRHFQAEHDLTVDGIVGPDTWKKLF